MLQPTGPLAVIVALLIHAVVPAAGLAAYAWIVKRMEAEACPIRPSRRCSSSLPATADG